MAAWSRNRFAFSSAISASILKKATSAFVAEKLASSMDDDSVDMFAAAAAATDDEDSAIL